MLSPSATGLFASVPITWLYAVWCFSPQQRPYSTTCVANGQRKLTFTRIMSYSEDDSNLARLGYKQEFKRAFTPLEVFGIAFNIIGLFPSIAYVV